MEDLKERLGLLHKVDPGLTVVSVTVEKVGEK
jgi:hypothetical protein